MKFDFFGFLNDIGLDAKYLVNGFVGALIWSIYKKLKFKDALRQILIGSFVAGYLTPVIADKLNASPQFIASTSFVVGMMGMVIVDSIYKWTVRKLAAVRKGEEILIKSDDSGD